MQIINTTPHIISFLDENGNDLFVESCGVLINAKVEETLVTTKNGVSFVKSVFVADEANEIKLTELEEKYPGSIIVGSIIAAQAFPGRVFGMTPEKGYERVAINEKRMSLKKFTTF